MFSCTSSDRDNRLKRDRQRMVDEQISARGIKHPNVLNALLKVPRHQFVPAKLRDFAYKDCPLVIGYEQTISQPYIVAYMTAIAQIAPTDHVLEIGTGCGYQAAVLAELAAEVYTVEIIPELNHIAQKTLKNLGYNNIHFQVGDGYLGWQEFAPYHAIIVTAAPTHVPQPLIEQLAPRSRMVIPVGDALQYIEVLQKTETKILTKKMLAVRFVPLRRSPKF